MHTSYYPSLFFGCYAHTCTDPLGVVVSGCNEGSEEILPAVTIPGPLLRWAWHCCWFIFPYFFTCLWTFWCLLPTLHLLFLQWPSNPTITPEFPSHWKNCFHSCANETCLRQVKASSDKAVLTSLRPQALRSQHKACGLLQAVTVLYLLGCISPRGVFLSLQPLQINALLPAVVTWAEYFSQIAGLLMPISAGARAQAYCGSQKPVHSSSLDCKVTNHKPLEKFKNYRFP